jgi:hypothetical protein
MVPIDARAERPFEGKEVYFSGPISAAGNSDLNLNWDLVQFMKDGGAHVLSEHVGGRSFDERNDIFLKNFGRDRRMEPEPWFFVRGIDIAKVDAATHVVAIVNKPSLGIGIEVQRAIDKPKMGLNSTPILCLIQEEVLDELSFMVRGISREENPDFFLEIYKDDKDARKKIFNFLTMK